MNITPYFSSFFRQIFYKKISIFINKKAGFIKKQPSRVIKYDTNDNVI